MAVKAQASMRELLFDRDCRILGGGWQRQAARARDREHCRIDSAPLTRRAVEHFAASRGRAWADGADWPVQGP